MYRYKHQERHGSKLQATTTLHNIVKTLWSAPARLANLCLSLVMSLLISQAQQALATTDFSADLVLGQENFTAAGGSNRGAGASTLSAPRRVAVGGGRIYIADTDNSRVLWWNSASFANGQPADGVIGQRDMVQHYANKGEGSVATANTLSYPYSVAVDGEGNVWVADTENYRVLKFAPPTTNNPDAILVIGQPDMTTNSSNYTAANHFYPMDIAVDETGNVWVCDGGNSRILRFDAPSANAPAASIIIATDLNRPAGIAMDQGGNLWVADTVNNRVLKFAAPLASGQSPSLVLGQTSMAGTAENAGQGDTNASAYGLRSPYDLAMDKNGDLWVADTTNNRVLKYVSPFANGQAAALVLGQADMLHGDGNRGGMPAADTISIAAGVATDSDGNIWVADKENNRIVKYIAPSENGQAAAAVLGQAALDTNASTQVGADTFNENSFLAVSEGRLYVADSINNRILWWSIATLKNAANGAAADGVIGQADMVHGNANRGAGIPSAYTLNSPQGLAFDKDGNLWVADAYNNRVLKFAKPSSNGPSAILVLGQSDMAHGDANRGDTAPAANSLGNPEGLVFDKDGNLWVADRDNNRVLMYAPPFSTGQAASLVLGQVDMEHGFQNRGGDPSAETLSSPYGIAADADGNLWVADMLNNRVLKYHAPISAGAAAELVLGQASMTDNGPERWDYSNIGGGSLANPYSVRVDAFGNIWVSDAGNSRVLRYNNPTANGWEATRVVGQADMTQIGSFRNTGVPTQDGMNYPRDAILDKEGGLWVSDGSHSRVVRFTLQQNASGNISSGGNGLAGVTVTASGRTSSTTVTDSLGNYTLKLIDGETATLTPSKTGYAFSPPTLSTAALANDWQGNNFSAALATHTVSCSVVEGSAPLAGVIISVSGSTATFSIDTNGNYSFQVAAGGSYTLVPSLPGYSFTPPSISTSALSADWTGIAFTAIRNTLSASGTVLSGGKPLPEMTVTISGGTIGSAKSDASGRFAFALAPGGAYTITPSMTGYSFTPPSVSTVSLAAAWTADFTATPSYTLSGLVKAGGAALAGALISISGDTTASATTDSTGRYTLTLGPGNYVLKPSRAGYYFDPPYHAVTPLSADTVLDFTSGGMDGKSAVVEGGPNGYVEPKKGPAKIRLIPPQNGHVTIKAYTLRNARLVATLEADVNAGEVSTIIWDCLNTDGEMLGSGIYMLNINGAGYNNHKIKLGVLK